MTTPVNMSVSVVVTAFNHAAYIRQALESVLGQAVRGLEVIVVDDGSTDATFDIAQEFTAHGFHVLRQVNGGPSSAVNTGLARATGDCIVLFSADDMMNNASIENRMRVLEGGDVDFVCSLPVWIGADGYELPYGERVVDFVNFGMIPPLDLFMRLYYEGNCICAPSVAFTRDAWKDVGAFNETLWQLQDYDYWLRAAAIGKRFFCLSEPCVSYRWHGGNLSSIGLRLNDWESDLVQGEVPKLLSREDMLEILFGRSFRNVETQLSADDCRALIQMRHKRPSAAAGGLVQFKQIVATQSGSDRFCKALS